MIVDVHTFLWDSPEQLGTDAAARLRRRAPDPWTRPFGSVAVLEQMLAPGDCAIVLGFRSLMLEARIGHAQIAAYVEQLAGKAVGFAGIDPYESDWRASLDDAVARHLQGVVVSPAAQGNRPDFGPAMELFEQCQARRLPVMVVGGLDLSPRAIMEYAQPMLLDVVARTFPQLRLIIGSMGDPFVEQTLALLDRHEHALADVAGLTTRPQQLTQCLTQARDRGVIDRLLLGSGFPHHTPTDAARAIMQTRELTRAAGVPLLPQDLLRNLVHRDALALLGIAAPHPPAVAVPNTNTEGKTS